MIKLLYFSKYDIQKNIVLPVWTFWYWFN